MLETNDTQPLSPSTDNSPIRPAPGADTEVGAALRRYAAMSDHDIMVRQGRPRASQLWSDIDQSQRCSRRQPLSSAAWLSIAERLRAAAQLVTCGSERQYAITSRARDAAHRAIAAARAEQLN